MELIYTIIIVFCLIFGFYTGYKIGKEQTLPKVPKEIIHPIQTIKENKKSKEEEEKLEILQNNLQELDNYGG